MDKLKYVKLENPDGSYSESIPLAVDSDYVDVNGNTLTNEINSKATKSELNNLQNQIDGLASGSPLVASSTSEMIDTTKTYVNITNGKWYYYNGASWTIGGTYQSTEVADNSIKFLKLEEKIQDFLKYSENLSSATITIGQSVSNSNGNIIGNRPKRARTGRNRGSNSGFKYIYVNGTTYDISVQGYSSNSGEWEEAFVGGSDGWLDGSIFEIPSTFTYISLAIKRNDDANMSDSDIEAIQESIIRVKYELDTTLTQEGKIPDAKIIGDRLANIENYQPYQSGLITFDVEINKNVLVNDESDTSTSDTVKCALMLPESYSPTGDKTQLVLCCHGASGVITNNSWYNENWTSFMNDLLSKGYAVFDTNRVSSTTDASGYGKTYGSPIALESLKKAYDYIVKNYNVTDKIFVHGTSMGGTTAQAFCYAYPNIIKACSCFASANTLYSIWWAGENQRNDNDAALITNCFDYATRSLAKTDNYQNMVGYITALNIQRFNSSNQLINDNIATIEDAIENNINGGFWNNTNEKWFLKFPVPIKMWTGTADTPNFITFNECIVKAIRNAGGIAYQKLVENGTHTTVSYGQVDNMRNELDYWYKRFK